ncbi:MAG: alpha-ketoacid dehydrogenase subunit alpha/beta [Flavobacteriaceae bacterium]
MSLKTSTTSKINFDTYKERVLLDYRIGFLSRFCSLLGRREVLTGKGSFGIFGDGKELPQIAMNHFFRKGDFRAGYYRDQTFLMAQGHLDVAKFFAAIYAHPSLEKEPMSGGRQMGGHFNTRSIDENGEWLDLMAQHNHSSDISPTGGQMPRLVGLAHASKIYRERSIANSEKFSANGNEIAWGTIGNASAAEGLFFEAVNAIGILQVPVILSIYDDGYGISVSNKDQMTKGSVSEALAGFQKEGTSTGLEILQVKGWDYAALMKTYSHAEKLAREKHIPVLVHVQELTQPLGHSTSGSHERYKSQKRLAWEKEYDGIIQFKNWILSQGIASEEALEQLEKAIDKEVREGKRLAWDDYCSLMAESKKELVVVFDRLAPATQNDVAFVLLQKELTALENFGLRELMQIGRKALLLLRQMTPSSRQPLVDWIKSNKEKLHERYSTHLYNENLPELKILPARYPSKEEWVDGRIVLRDNFDALLEKEDRLLIFGEDVGKIGDVNQGTEGLQKKYGEDRVFDTGIREATIIGQGIGMALRGLRPIAEIQYLDYMLYALHILSDDLACMNYRTKGQQIAPLIIRTRGHRLEGIWHSGSPMGTLLHSLRGIYLLVPRNLTQAAAMYNSLLQINQPALVVEPLNGYRLKEKRPSNLGEFTIPLGTVEVVQEGSDITAVSYGATFHILEEAAKEAATAGISVEVIDAQSLLPFDIEGSIGRSVAKTNRLLIVDEDMPGGATAYLLQQLIDKQDIFQSLDSAPCLISAKEHRPPYGNDGDYASKPSKEDIVEALYQIMSESDPTRFPKLY